MNAHAKIIEAALSARTEAQAVEVQQLIEKDVGARYERPLTDTWQNLGGMSSTGSFDHKIIEDVTNMQDAVVERHAKARFGDLATVPYQSPQEAARALLGHMRYEEIAKQVCVDFYESDPPTRTSKRITAVFRDRGCGIETGYVSKSIFAQGSTHKSHRHWQQGAFGHGAKATFRNARAIVLVSRRAPEFEPAEDRITVAVVLWTPYGKGIGAYYLTTTDWGDGEHRSAEPWSAPATAFPGFEAGTHLALLSYGVEGFHRKEGDQRGFDRVMDTRLFAPVTPVRFTNNIITTAHPKNLRGLRRQLEENPREDRREQTATLPYRIRGKTYHLPITAYVFMGKAGHAGARRNFVAHDHAVVFTSSGQIHHHWKPSELPYKTKLNRLYDRLFAVVETDELPIEIRTQLFTATRTGLVPQDDARRLEAQVAALLDEWDFLRDINGELIRDALMAKANGRPTLQVAKQISRALKIRGFSMAATQNDNGREGGRNPRPRKQPMDLYTEPTALEGPQRTTAEPGTVKTVRYVLNARDEFLNDRHGTLVVTCDHPDITDREITIGQLHNGTVRVMVAVPDEAALGSFKLTAVIDNWARHAGGFGGYLEWCTDLQLAEADEPGERTKQPPKGQSAQEGSDIVLIWDDSEHDGWNPSVPGSVDEEPAKDIAVREEYKELAALGDTLVPTIYLNEDYAPLRRYIAGRKDLISETGPDRAKNRYAVGIGVGLVMLDQEARPLAKKGKMIDDEVLLAAKRATAQAALSVLPEFDQLAKEAGVDA